MLLPFVLDPVLAPVSPAAAAAAAAAGSVTPVTPVTPLGVNVDAQSGLLLRLLLLLRGTTVAGRLLTGKVPEGVADLLLAAEGASDVLRHPSKPGSGLGLVLEGIRLFSVSKAFHASSISSDGSVASCSCLLLLRGGT